MAAFDFRYKLLAVESGMFLAIQLLAVFVGAIFVQKGLVQQMPVQQALPSFLIAFAIAMVVMVAVLYFLKTPKTFGIFFAFIIFIGTEIVFEAFVPSLIAAALAIIVVMVRVWKPNVLTHNIAIFLTIAGISAQLGMMLPVPAVIIIILALSVYDYLAVFKFKTMVKMFRQMLERGAPFAIIVPESAEHFSEHVGKVSKEKLAQVEKRGKAKKSEKPRFMMLGTGDLAFPAVFAVSAYAQYNIAVSAAIIAGAMVGLVVNHYYLTKKFQAIPALPAIAVFSTLGFILSQLPSWI
ncbi:MAG: presenilin family intramembrane aspartyl protease [archaeon]